MKIYLASSWRNFYHRLVLAGLRSGGHEVYDFKNPVPGNEGFSWRQVDPELPLNLTAERMRATLAHPISQAGFDYDFDAMKWADAFVLLLPCGNSAHMEAGWAGGAGKPVVVLAPEIREPELMYKLFEDRVRHAAVGTARLAGALEGTPMFATVEEVLEHLRTIRF